MTVARTLGMAVNGLAGELVDIEATVSAGLPGCMIIGLADRALAEAEKRVRAATSSCALALPNKRFTVNLTPANLPKQGSGFDVGIALALLASAEMVPVASMARTVHLGELGLDGRLRPVPGVLPAVMAAVRAGVPRVVVAPANEREARLVEGAEIVAAPSLADVIELHGGEATAPPLEAVMTGHADPPPRRTPELSDVVGQRDAVDALIVAAAGGHHLMMSGPPGAGKTMLAERLPGILPSLSTDDALEVAAVRSLSGLAVTSLSHLPPFEAPHHSASVAALVGGGSRLIRPGAVARATNGILFLDEAGEFQSSALDALRQPLEKGTITIHRAGASAQFPARFQLVLATNPCPCGNHGIPGAECVCTPTGVRRYRARLSGPLMDRIDIELGLRRVNVAHTDALPRALSTARAREAVVEARGRAARRLADTPWRRNAEVPGHWLRGEATRLSTAVTRPLDAALHRGALTLRGYDRVLRVAWTIADLAGHDSPDMHDVGRALYMKKGIVA